MSGKDGKPKVSASALLGEKRAAVGSGGTASLSKRLSSLGKLKAAVHRSFAVDSISGGFSSVGGEKAAIVLDIGAAYTKCGFGNEAVPRHIIKSEISHGGTLVPVYDPEERRPISDLREILIQFLHEIMYTRLLVKTTDRRVVLIEQLAAPARFRETITDLLYRHYMVGSVLHIPAATLATVPLWLNSALVVDCGYTEATVTAVFDGVPAVNSFRAVAAGATAVHGEIASMLKETVSGAEISEAILEDIKVRGCIAGRLPEGTVLPTLAYSPKGFSESFHLDHKLRSTACDPLFDGVDSDGSSIATAILDSLLACPVDTRKQLAGQLVLCGGTAMLPGFRHRLAGALRTAAKEPRYKKLLGSLAKRTIVSVTLGTVGTDELDDDDLRAHSHRIVDDVLDMGRKAEMQISGSRFEVLQDQKILVTVYTPDDPDEGVFTGKISYGQRMYAVLTTKKEVADYSTGIADAFGFIDCDIPENIICWVGASVLGALETLPTKSIGKEAYLRSPRTPDFTSNTIIQSESTTDEPQPQPQQQTKWRTPVGRPMAWGYGSLAETKIQHVFPKS